MMRKKLTFGADRSRGIRHAAVLFLASGSIGLVNDLLPGSVAARHPRSIWIDAANLLVGAVVWACSKSRFLRGRLALVLPLVAITNVALSNWMGGLPTTTLGIWFVLIYVWVGIWFPRGTVAATSPVAAAAYLVPLWYGAPRSAFDVISVFLVIPVAVLAGETVAASMTSLRTAQAHQQKMLGELARASMTDPLTGVGNRRLADMLLGSLTAGDAVVLLDLDHFKAVNDTYGHPVGDETLRNLGAYLKGCMRGNDAAARVGGEEFVVVLRNTQGSEDEVAQRIVSGWRATAPITTVSAGVAIHLAGRTPDATYEAADAALYSAKRRGRDRVVSAFAPSPSPKAA